MNIDVVIPTRNRPDRLIKCLEALERAKEYINFEVYVCDSSTTVRKRQEVENVCTKFEFVSLHFHGGNNVAAARNFCAKVASAPLLVNVDDDIYVEPKAILTLYNSYLKSEGNRVIAGSVAWDNDWSAPVVMRSIGYGRKAKANEKPSFLIGAFFLYPREFALKLPWNERIKTSDDRFMGAVWRSHNIHLLYESNARAFHDHQHTAYDVKHQESHIYANMFDTLIANFNVRRAISYQFLGFAASAKLYLKDIRTVFPFFYAWIKGNAAFVKDYKFLKKYTRIRL
ncbi:glycosyltransferase family 2 protein [Metabacillus litoralis]|uniref:glycosyltransferase family 2 protein n=1 Tax=Metabacillus litoralis TaxID=152268 RepID=UPI0020421236|nr:glycosyltransferase family 2 protein [Metabacillus litoralis]MCM3161735.1 glycosyltransferase [Metabacillus litoralis]